MKVREKLNRNVHITHPGTNAETICGKRLESGWEQAEDQRLLTCSECRKFQRQGTS